MKLLRIGKDLLRNYPTYILFLFILYVCLSSLELRNFNGDGFITHFIFVNRFYNNRRKWSTSKLGAILFKGDKVPQDNVSVDRRFNVLMWKHWNWVQLRHVYNYQRPRNGTIILHDCSVKNCVFMGNDNLIDIADAVVVYLQKWKFPPATKRKLNQRWILWNEESPVHASGAKWRTYGFLDKVFNWSMTYRTDADVPIPYGRSIPLDEPIFADPTSADIATLVPYWDQKQTAIPASILMSNCRIPARNLFLEKVMKHMKVDVYGRCSKVHEFQYKCPGHYTSDCNITKQYLFYLALENSQCSQYVTEKVFHYGFAKGAVPVIWGPQYDDLRTLLPPDSFIYVDQNTDVEVLVKEIMNLIKNMTLYLSKHRWRNHFKIVNEHGFAGTKSKYLCRICEALNYNDKREKVLSMNELNLLLNDTTMCKQT